jgi:hypothetical protein
MRPVAGQRNLEERVLKAVTKRRPGPGVVEGGTDTNVQDGPGMGFFRPGDLTTVLRRPAA